MISDEPAFFLTTIPTDGFRANPHTYRHRNGIEPLPQ
jgi:hypothetical protein